MGGGGGVAVTKEDPRVPQHQELELEPEMLFVSEDEVINLPINSSSRNFVASTILEVVTKHTRTSIQFFHSVICFFADVF